MDNNKKPSNVTNAFMDKVTLTERQAIRIAIEQLAKKDPSIKTNYDKLVERQEKSLQAIKDHQKRQRDKEIKKVKLMLLDENDPSINRKRVYRPKYWPRLQQKQLAEAAESDARYIVTQDERRRIEVVKEKFTEDRQRYLSDAVKSLQQHTKTFNRSADPQSHNRSRDQSQDRGYDR